MKAFFLGGFLFYEVLIWKKILDLYDKIVEHIQYLKDNIIDISEGGDSPNDSN